MRNSVGKDCFSSQDKKNKQYDNFVTLIRELIRPRLKFSLFLFLGQIFYSGLLDTTHISNVRSL